MTHGGYAEYVKVPFRNVLPIPENLSFEQAAAFPLVSVTASHMLFALGGLQHGETVLIMGAGSGVGMMAVQMAKLAGARVMTTVGSDDKIPKAVTLGADAVFNHTKENVAERVKLLTEGRGVDVVIEHIGPEVWDTCLHSLGERRTSDYLWRNDGGRCQAESSLCLFAPAHNQGVLYGHACGIGEGGGADRAGPADLGDRSDLSVTRSARGAGADAKP